MLGLIMLLCKKRQKKIFAHLVIYKLFECSGLLDFNKKSSWDGKTKQNGF